MSATAASVGKNTVIENLGLTVCEIARLCGRLFCYYEVPLFYELAFTDRMMCSQSEFYNGISSADFHHLTRLLASKRLVRIRHACIPYPMRMIPNPSATIHHQNILCLPNTVESTYCMAYLIRINNEQSSLLLRFHDLENRQFFLDLLLTVKSSQTSTSYPLSYACCVANLMQYVPKHCCAEHLCVRKVSIPTSVWNRLPRSLGLRAERHGYLVPHGHLVHVKGESLDGVQLGYAPDTSIMQCSLTHSSMPDFRLLFDVHFEQLHNLCDYIK